MHHWNKSRPLLLYLYMNAAIISKKARSQLKQTAELLLCPATYYTVQFQPLASHRPLTISCTTPHTSMKLKYQPKLLWLVVQRRKISAHFFESETSVTISCTTPHTGMKLKYQPVLLWLVVEGARGGSVFWTGIGAICKCWAAWVAKQLARDSNGFVFSVYSLCLNFWSLSPSTGLQHPSSKHCHNWSCHRSPKNC